MPITADAPVLPVLRRVLRDARAVAARQRITVRVRLEPKEKQLPISVHIAALWDH